jgi:aminoglycoside phosphotransferase (APT) family kinase protein
LSLCPGYGPPFYGAVKAAERSWLFIEHLEGKELYQTGEWEVWESVARGLARMHAISRPLVGASPTLQRRLVRHDGDQPRKWYQRACSIVQRVRGEQAQRRLSALSSLLPAMEESLAAGPRTLVHGEFYPSNILVSQSPSGCLVRAVDWEMAAMGSGLLDLAALLAGRWTQQQQHSLALAYFEEQRCLSGEGENVDDFFTRLNYCRLYTALRWLGWSDNWSAPPAQAHDWLAEALDVAERLGQVT